MPLYIADYLADTQHLSAPEHGAYLLLIMHYWQKGSLPTEDRRLASIARATPEQWSDMRDTIAEFFDDGWCHTRIDVELEEAAKKYQKRAEAGRKGGKAKADGKQSHSNAEAGLNQPQPQPPSSPKNEDANASSKRAIEREFNETFWPAYPLKRGKPEALRAFIAARKRASLETIMIGVNRYAAERMGQDSKFTKHPQGWLSGDHWDDQPAAPQQRATAPPRSGVSAAAQQILESENNGPEGIFGDHGNAKRLPAAGGGGSRNAASDLPGGIGRQFLTIDH